MFNMFRGLVGSKTLDKETMAPVLDKMRDHLTGNNAFVDNSPSSHIIITVNLCLQKDVNKNQLNQRAILPYSLAYRPQRRKGRTPILATQKKEEKIE